MKLYYDMLVPYMPDAIKDEKGELVPNKVKTAGRLAMMELANFQNSGNTLSLYQAVLYGCIYAEVDLVDTIMNISNIECPFDVGATKLIDLAVRSLFESITSCSSSMPFSRPFSTATRPLITV